MVPKEKIDEILKSNRFYETQSAKTKWKADGWTKCEKDRVDIKSAGVRCVHFVFPSDKIAFDYSTEDDVPVHPSAYVPKSTPVSDYAVDDAEALNKVLNQTVKGV